MIRHRGDNGTEMALGEEHDPVRRTEYMINSGSSLLLIGTDSSESTSMKPKLRHLHGIQGSPKLADESPINIPVTLVFGFAYQVEITQEKPGMMH